MLFYSSNEQGSNIDVFKYQHSLFRQRNHHTEKRQTDQGAQTPYNDKKVRGGGAGVKVTPHRSSGGYSGAGDTRRAPADQDQTRPDG